ncbi:MAG TPA: hypothetical protein VE843_06615, partial [Ktedonobacteraceae bacterium]|nr:hypothetical protein [Ktedonobacteraceae bacterium]
FLFVEPVLSDGFQQGASNSSQETPVPVPAVSNEAIEWWQEAPLQESTHKMDPKRAEIGDQNLSTRSSTKSEQHVTKDTDLGEPSIIPAKAHKTSAGQRTDLPSWLIDQPTQFEMPALRPSSLSGSNEVPVVPNGKANSLEKQEKKPSQRNANQSKAVQNSQMSSFQQSSAEWQLVEKPDVGQLQSLTSTKKTDDFSISPPQHKHNVLPTNTTRPALVAESLGRGSAAINATSPSTSAEFDTSTSDMYSRSNQKHNYASLTNALQTLSFAIPGFIATAIVNIDGQPIAQVAVEDQNISRICQDFSKSMQGMLGSLEAGAFGHYEDTIVTSLTHFILFRLIGSSRDVFQVLVVTRNTDPVECLEIMANIEPILEAAL